MTDHGRARECYRIACAMADRKPNPRSARPWLARAAGYHPTYARTWGDDGWPEKARAVLDEMATLHPMQWPEEWRV